MHITVDWDNENRTIIRFQFQRGWTWDNLRAAIGQADDLITSVDHPVNLVIDIREAGAIPADFMSGATDIFASGEARANEGVKVVVGAGRLVRMAYDALRRLYGSKLEGRPFLFASSLEEAYKLLKQRVPDAP